MDIARSDRSRLDMCLRYTYLSIDRTLDVHNDQENNEEVVHVYILYASSIQITSLLSGSVTRIYKVESMSPRRRKVFINKRRSPCLANQSARSKMGMLHELNCL